MAGGLDIVLQVGIWGLYAGCIYILLAIGLNLIFGVMKVVNFAHGEFLMLGAYVTFTFYAISGFNPYVLLVASVPILILIGGCIGGYAAKNIAMTAMPQLVAAFHSLVGLAAVFVAAAAFYAPDSFHFVADPSVVPSRSKS